MGATRREFLQLVGGTLAAGTAACKTLERGMPEEYSVEKPPVRGAENWAPGEERLLRSVCLQCKGGCGIEVRVVEGRAVKIEGNPDYPTNRGGLCPKGLNGLQTLYDPDRIRGPLLREGPRGAGGWRRIPWNQAVGIAAERLGAVREAGRSHAVAILGGRYRGHMRALVSRWLRAYGSPNDIDHESLCATSDKVAYELSQGIRDHMAYDLERTSYVLSFGAGFVESFRPTAMMLRLFGHLRQGVPGQRGKIVQIDPRFGVSAARADEWVQVRPGTDGALALGIAHVLVREGLHDAAFVRDRTLGFETWTDSGGRTRPGFKEWVLEQYAPDVVAGMTGVSADVIERLAREFAANRPAVALCGRGVAAHTNGVHGVLAVHALNALAGSIDAPGGVLVQRYPPFASWPEPELDEVARHGLQRPRVDLAGAGVAPFAESQMATLPDRILAGEPYPIEAVLLYYTNPAFSAPGPGLFREALARVPFVVSFSPFLDESTMMADLVLPDHTYLERWQIDVPPPSTGFPVFGLRRPVVEPLHDTHSTGDALAAIARAIGGAMARSFPWSELDMIKYLVRGVQESGRGSIRAPDFDTFWEQLLRAGGWWDPPYRHGEWDRVLATASGKYEFWCARLEGRSTGGRADEPCLPRHESPQAAGRAGTFGLICYKTMMHAEGRGANQPHLQEAFGVQFDRSWGPWVEVHPDDARAIGVQDDDLVRLRTAASEVRARVVIHDGAYRGVVNVPFEYGHSAYGRWANGRGENPNLLLLPAIDPLSGSVAWYDGRVDVERIEDEA